MITYIKFYSNPIVWKSIKSLDKEFRGSSPLGATKRGGYFVDFFKFQKSPVGEDEKKTHSKFHRDQTNDA